ncbi:hCG1748577 [Homo sapiens]
MERHAGLLVSAVPGLCLSWRRRPGARGHVPGGPGQGPAGRVGPSVPGRAADSATDRGTRGQQGHPSTAGLVPATGLPEPLREASTHPLPGQASCHVVSCPMERPTGKETEGSLQPTLSEELRPSVQLQPARN